ncbi:2Fe-2S iron-sulfur cluster-binding protein [Vibrio sp.]|uniref:2Fe-2S iron-sulfur cluster-binding protein n=1 Tax=Vibrio sp. TaxID=678 RepID=UPI003D13DA73
MTHTVTVQPSQLQFDVREGQTVLQAALNNNIGFPHRCQIGACASCLCRLLSGEVEYQLEPMLTENEREQGWIFACQAYAKSDLIITFDE